MHDAPQSDAAARLDKENPLGVDGFNNASESEATQHAIASNCTAPSGSLCTMTVSPGLRPSSMAILSHNRRW